MNCDICTERAGDDLIISGEYRLSKCSSCKAARLNYPIPKGKDYYLEQYRQDVPRSTLSIVNARSEDALAASAILRLYGGKPLVALDMCAEDHSVSDWAILGEDCKVHTSGLAFEHRTDYFRSIDVAPENGYDAITCFTSLEHIENPGSILKEAQSKLKSGGLFIASVPNVTMNDLGLRPHHTWYFLGHSLSALVGRYFRVFAEIRLDRYLYVAATLQPG